MQRPLTLVNPLLQTHSPFVKTELAGQVTLVDGLVELFEGAPVA